MDKDTTTGQEAQGVCWESLEGLVRERIQGWRQDLLEAEVTEFLGRAKHVRREAGEAHGGYRNGYGKARQVTLSCGPVTVQRPRVRGIEERLESRILPPFVKRSATVAELLPQLYLHGLALGDFDLALRGLLGEAAPLSPATIGRLKAGWQGEYAAWQQRRLEELEVVYMGADGIYIKAGLEKDKSCLLVLVGALSDGRKVVLGLESGHRESKESWARRLRSLRDRGLACPKLVVGDGALGLWGALRAVYPSATAQRCWNHRMMNALDRIKQKDQETARRLLRQIVYADSRARAETAKGTFQSWGRSQGYGQAAAMLDEDWERMVAFYAFPKAHWQHLRTTNPVESPFAALRLRTEAAKRFKKVENDTAVVWKLLRVAEQRFRRLNAPGLLQAVWQGGTFVDGVRREPAQEAPLEGAKTAA